MVSSLNVNRLGPGAAAHRRYIIAYMNGLAVFRHALIKRIPKTCETVGCRSNKQRQSQQHFGLHVRFHHRSD